MGIRSDNNEIKYCDIHEPDCEIFIDCIVGTHRVLLGADGWIYPHYGYGFSNMDFAIDPEPGFVINKCSRDRAILELQRLNKV